MTGVNVIILSIMFMAVKNLKQVRKTRYLHGLTYLRVIWEHFNPKHVEEEEMTGKYFAAIYYNIKARGMLFMAKVNRIFLVDSNGRVHSIEVECLKPAVGNTIILLEIPEHLPRDIGLFHIHDVISGPLEMVRLKNGK